MTLWVYSPASPFIGFECVGVDFGSALDVLTDGGLQDVLAGGADDQRADLAGLVWSVPLQEPHDGDLAHTAGARNLLGALALVHEARFASDEGFVGLDFGCPCGCSQ